MNADMRDESSETHGVLPRLVRRYIELSELCYRVAVVAHDRRGRFQKGHRAGHPHPALLKKVDLDRALARVYQRFFEPSYRVESAPTTKSQHQGGDVRRSTRGPSSTPASRSE